jgi:hypothetical protein
VLKSSALAPAGTGHHLQSSPKDSQMVSFLKSQLGGNKMQMLFSQRSFDAHAFVQLPQKESDKVVFTQLPPHQPH